MTLLRQAPEAGWRQADGEVSVADLPSMVWRGKWYVCGATVVALTLGAVFLTVTVPLYDVQARLLVQQQGMPLQETSDAARWDKEFLATQAEIIRSPEVVRRAVQAYRLVAPAGPEADPTASILVSLRVAPVLGTNVLSVKFSSPNPRDAQRTVSGIIESYRKYLREHEQDTQLESLRLLTRSEKELRDDLAQREEEYLRLREQSPLLGGRGQDAVTIQLARLTKLSESLGEVTSRRLELQNLHQVMEQANRLAYLHEGITRMALTLPADHGIAQLAAVSTDGGLPTASGVLAQFIQQEMLPRDGGAIQAELTRAQAVEHQLAANYGPKHPDVQAAREEVMTWKNRQREYTESAPATLKHELTAVEQYEKQLAELYESELHKAKEVDGYVIRETQALDGIARVQAMHSSLLSQLRQWQLAEQALAGGRLRVTTRVLEEPLLPEQPAWPMPSLVMAVSAAMGLCGGLGLALLHPPRPAKVSVVTAAGRAVEPVG